MLSAILGSLCSVALTSAGSASGFPAINHLPLPAEKSKFVFVVMGDNRPAGPGLPPTPTFKEILKEIGYIKPAFVLSTGDLVYGYGDTVARYSNECSQVKTLVSKIGVPFFNAPGNHEIASRPELEATYKKLMGKSYGAFEYGGMKFIAMSTDEADSTDLIADKQMTWLQSALSGDMPKVVFYHRPVFARKGVTEEGATIQPASKLHDMFLDGQVKAAFEGHDHVFNEQVHDGIHYVIAGGSGAPLDAPPAEGGFFNYAVVTVDNGQVTIEDFPLNALDVEPIKNGAAIATYSDYDVQLNGVKIKTSFKPTAASALIYGKAKPKKAKAKIERTTKVAGGYLSVISVKAVHHKLVRVTLSK